MEYHNLEFAGLTRRLPIVSLTPKVRIASFNLLGDAEFTQVAAKEIVKKIKDMDFDCLVGPEVKVVPIMQEVSRFLKQKRYVIFRKNITGYMVSPKKCNLNQGLYLDGRDYDYLKGKKVIVVDDVVTTGKTLLLIGEFLKEINSKVVLNISVFAQKSKDAALPENFISLADLPVFYL